MKRVQITQGHECLVDDEDFAKVSQHRWCYSSGYAVRRKKMQDAGTGASFMHRELASLTKSQIEKRLVVLHADGNKLNNQKANLVVCDRSIRQQRMAARGSSGYKGVFQRGKGKWVAHIGEKGGTTYLGVFDSQKEAARAYDAAAKRIFGGLASLNFSEDKPPLVGARGKRGGRKKYAKRQKERSGRTTAMPHMLRFVATKIAKKLIYSLLKFSEACR